MRYSKFHKTAEIARLPRLLVAGSGAAIVLVVALLTLTTPQPASRHSLPAFSLAPPQSALASPLAAREDKPLRLVYRNSVVPGGVHSAAELAAVIARDPLAAAHYANIDVAKAHLVRVEQSRLVHVSYRIGNHIYWTKNKVRLALGEMLLSDGEHLIRARCGNRIADEAQAPVLLNEPAPEILETAFVSADDLIDQTVSMAALEAMPAQPGLADATAAQRADAVLPARAAGLPFGLPFGSPFGSPELLRLPTLPGITVLGPRTEPGAAPDPVLLPVAPADPLSPDAVAALPPAPTPTADMPGSTPSMTPATGDGLAAAPTQTGGSDGGDGTPPSSSPPSSPTTPVPPFVEPPASSAPPNQVVTPLPHADVPEPGSALLVGLALLALLAARRPLRRR